MNYLISIIIPVYNVEIYLSKCVDSIINQVGDDIEVILIDDGSTDSSGRLCDEYRKCHSNIKVFHQQNGGQGTARNLGVKKASGEYIFFVDSDDYIEDGAIKNLIHMIVSGKKPDIIIFNYNVVDNNGNKIKVEDGKSVGFRMPTSEFVKSSVRMAINPSPWNKLFKRSYIIGTGQTFPGRVWYEDLRTIPKWLTLTKNVSYISDVIYDYVIHPSSAMNNNKTNVSRNIELTGAFDDLRDFINSYSSNETFEPVLEYMAIQHILLAGTVRVGKVDKDSIVINELIEYVSSKYPNWYQNRYLSSFTLKQRFYLLLIRFGILRYLKWLVF